VPTAGVLFAQFPGSMFFVGGGGGGFSFEGGHPGGFPGGFPGMGGPPGGGRRSKPVDTTKLYKILEVEQDASESKIKTAYRKLAIKHHPDKGGDPEKFKEITRAYEVLSDREKRAAYDRGGEEALDGDGGMDAGDIFAQMFGKGGGRGGAGGGRRPKTKDVVQPLKATLEQIYNGQTKKMAITRKVIDKKTFKPKQEREVLEVHIQKGSPDGRKIQFRGMADEHPEADPGDVVFVVKQEEHKIFKRKGADLFLEKEVSLVEALCGFEMELTHLDGRQLLIKTSPGDIIRPMPRGLDPMETTEGKTEWEAMEGFDCPGIDNVAQADLTDVDTLKKAVETQLKRKGIDVGAFVVDGQRAYFKPGTREEVLASKKPRKNCTMYVVADPNANASMRMLKAVKDEGMPTYKNPFIHGNLFLILTIKFPDALSVEAQQALRAHLPPALNAPPKLKVDDPDVELHTLTDIDPVKSYEDNKINMTAGKDAYDEDEDDRRPGETQCQQM